MTVPPQAIDNLTQRVLHNSADRIAKEAIDCLLWFLGLVGNAPTGAESLHLIYAGSTFEQKGIKLKLRGTKLGKHDFLVITERAHGLKLEVVGDALTRIRRNAQRLAVLKSDLPKNMSEGSGKNGTLRIYLAPAADQVTLHDGIQRFVALASPAEP